MVVKGYLEVDKRLQELRTSREWLIEVAEAMVAASNECTDNDPAGARGWRSWQMGTRRSRELHVGRLGWVKDDTDQIPSILNEDTGLKIIVCNTDEGTCIESRRPQNRSQKGPGTDRIADNNEADLFGGEHIPHPDSVVVLRPERRPVTGHITYTLCVYQDADELRAELSIIVETSNGYFSALDERIFIVGGEAEPPLPARRKDDDEGSDSGFDIPVKRKK